MSELQLLVLGIGLIIMAMIYLWGMRARIKSGLARRRRRRAGLHSQKDEPVLGTEPIESQPPQEGVDRLGAEGSVWSQYDPYADQRLVDVEIRRIEPPDEDSVAATANPETPPPAAADIKPPPAAADIKPPPAAADIKPPPAAADIKPPPAAADIKPPPAAAAVEAKAAVVERARKPASENDGKPGEPVKVSEQPAAPPATRKEPPRGRVAQEVEQPAQMTLLLTVMAPKGQPFAGVEVLQAAQDLDLKLNRSGVLNYLPPGKMSGDPVFSIAHLREPGSFTLDTIRTLATPGLLLYMQLPGPLDEVAAADALITSARKLAEKLGGTLCDEKHKRMTLAALTRLRGRAAEFGRHRAESSAQ